MYVTPGGGTVYTTDLKSVGASLTSSNLVWGIRERLDSKRNHCLVVEEI